VSEQPFRKNSVAMSISREMAIMHGVVEPTAEEVAQYNAASRVSWERDLEMWVEADAFRAALASVDDPVARVVLDLHRPIDADTAECNHCTSGEYADHDSWPCDTVEVVARGLGIAPPVGWTYRRPGPEPSTMPSEGYRPLTLPSAFVDVMARKMDTAVFDV
jgi:hypothetical protein